MGAFDIQYKPRTSIKGQVLADFVVEFTPKRPRILQVKRGELWEPRENTWQVYVDGASNCQGARVGIILISPEEIRLEKSFKLGVPSIKQQGRV